MEQQILASISHRNEGVAPVRCDETVGSKRQISWFTPMVMRSKRIQATKISLLQRVPRLSLRAPPPHGSSELNHCFFSSKGWADVVQVADKNASWTPPFGFYFLWGGDPGAEPELPGRIMYFLWLIFRVSLGRRLSGLPATTCCFTSRKRMDGRMTRSSDTWQVLRF